MGKWLAWTFFKAVKRMSIILRKEIYLLLETITQMWLLLQTHGTTSTFNERWPYQKKTLNEDNKDNTSICNVHIHVKRLNGNIKSSCEGTDKTLKRGHSAHLAAIEADDTTFYNIGYSTFTSRKEKQFSPKNRDYSVFAHPYSRLTTFVPEGDNNTLKRRDIKFGTTSMCDGRRGEENSKIRGTNFLFKYTNNISVMKVRGRSAWFLRISIGAKTNIIQTVSCFLDREAKTRLVSKVFMPSDWLLIFTDVHSPFFPGWTTGS